MTKEEILENLETVLPKLQHYIEFKEASLEQSERNIIIELGRVLMPEKVYNFSCGACAGELMTILYSYYQREKL